MPKEKNLCLGRQGAGEVVVALLWANLLHSDPQCTWEIVTAAKGVRAESCLETGINLML